MVTITNTPQLYSYMYSVDDISNMVNNGSFNINIKVDKIVLVNYENRPINQTNVDLILRLFVNSELQDKSQSMLNNWKNNNAISNITLVNLKYKFPISTLNAISLYNLTQLNLSFNDLSNLVNVPLYKFNNTHCEIFNFANTNINSFIIMNNRFQSMFRLKELYLTNNIFDEASIYYLFTFDLINLHNLKVFNITLPNNNYTLPLIQKFNVGVITL